MSSTYVSRLLLLASFLVAVAFRSPLATVVLKKGSVIIVSRILATALGMVASLFSALPLHHGRDTQSLLPAIGTGYKRIGTNFWHKSYHRQPGQGGPSLLSYKEGMSVRSQILPNLRDGCLSQLAV
jgi:hypothetical protein